MGSGQGEQKTRLLPPTPISLPLRQAVDLAGSRRMQVHQTAFVHNEVGVAVAILREKSSRRRTKDCRTPHGRIEKKRMCAHLHSIQYNL